MALYLVIQVSAFLSKVVPRPWRYRIGVAVGDVVYGIWRAKRRILQQNMATVTGLDTGHHAVRSLARASMRNYCKYLIEFLDLPALSSRHPAIAAMKIHGLEHLEEALKRGRGVIIATAHFGALEAPGLRLKDFTDFHAVYDTFTPVYLDRLIQKKRREKGIDLIPAHNVRAMLRVLHDGGALAMLFDRPVELARGVPVRFFGRQTAVPAGPATLALKTGATLLPIYTTRLPDYSFEAFIYPPITCSPSGDRERDVQVMTQRLMNTLQDSVRDRPDQWYMFRSMWPPSVATSSVAAAPNTVRPPG